MLLFNINFYLSQRQKTPIIGEGGGCNKMFFVNSLCFAKSERLSVFGPFWGKFWLMHKNTVNIGISAFFKRPKKAQQCRFWTLLSGPSGCYYLGKVCCNIKMANLAQIVASKNFGAQLLAFQNNMLKPLFVCVFDKQCLKNNFAQIITLKLAKLGPDYHIYIYICIYVYMYICMSPPQLRRAKLRDSYRRHPTWLK